MFGQQTADSRQQSADNSVTNAPFEMCITPSI